MTGGLCIFTRRPQQSTSGSTPGPMQNEPPSPKPVNPPPTPATPATSLEVRERLVEALPLDLVGPRAGHEYATERLPNWAGRMYPSTWYLTGYIVPSRYTPGEAEVIDEGDELEVTPISAGGFEESADEGKVAKRRYLPSSIGLSFQVHARTRELDVAVRWGDYAPQEIGDARVWQRTPHEARLQVELPDGDGEQNRGIPESNGLALQVATRSIPSPAGGSDATCRRSVSVFLVNRRTPSSSPEDVAFAFQPEIEVTSRDAYPAKPFAWSGDSGNWDDKVASLHYADRPEYATGHGVSADWDLINGECSTVRTAWIGTAEVDAVSTASADGVELSMEALGQLEDGIAARAALGPLVERYRTWIESQSATVGGAEPIGTELLRRAGIAASRMERGIQALADDPDVLDAFRVANRAVASALQRRSKIERPAWRSFQLGFILLNIPGLADP